MIEEAVKRFIDKKNNLRNKFNENEPDSYKDIVTAVIETITEDDEYGEFNPDPERVEMIDHGHYQGTLVFVIGSKGYQPWEYWYVTVSYGSCSGCDTLQAIQDDRPWDSNVVSSSQLDDYMTLALHIVQRLKKMED